MSLAVLCFFRKHLRIRGTKPVGTSNVTPRIGVELLIPISSGLERSDTEI